MYDSYNLLVLSFLSFFTALLLSLGFGPYAIRKLKNLQFYQPVRDDGPKSHLLSKTNTPTMGGILILFATIISTLLWAKWTDVLVWVLILTLLGFGAIGWLDDYRKLVLKNPRGLPARYKYLGQTILALIILAILHFSFATTSLISLPFFHLHLAWPVWGLVIAYFTIVGTSNAVNLTDGLDGLAIVPIMLVALGLGIIAYFSATMAPSFELQYLPEAQGAAIFCAALIGAGLGFLWFNAHPAQVFMGDVGALPLGAVLGVIAVVLTQELLLILMGGVFVVEALSVILQVASFKSRGKRIFKMSPLHHHFELSGCPEPKLVIRFWIFSAGLLVLSLFDVLRVFRPWH